MRLQPRREILNIWREVTRYSFRDGAFVWAGGPGAGDSVSDAEQLLCILLPATELPALRVDLPDQTANDVGEALSLIGDVISLPRRLIRSLTEYMTRYTDGDGPTFPGGRYLTSTDPEVSALDVLESYALGVRLSLAALGFARVYRTTLSRNELIEETATLEDLASHRLTCAMIGLLRCFAIHGFYDNSQYANTCAAPSRKSTEKRRRCCRSSRPTWQTCAPACTRSPSPPGTCASPRKCASSAAGRGHWSTERHRLTWKVHQYQFARQWPQPFHTHTSAGSPTTR